MRGKPAAKLGGFILIMLVAAYLAVFGLTLGMFEFYPWQGTVQRGMELAGGKQAVYSAVYDDVSTQDALSQTRDALRARLASLGMDDATVTTRGEVLCLEIPASSAQSDAKLLELITKQGVLEITNEAGDVLLTGADVKAAQGTYDRSSALGTPVLYLVFSSQGTKNYKAALQDNVGGKLEIKIDGHVLETVNISATTVTNAENFLVINNSDFAIDDVIIHAINLRSGPLPLAIEEDIVYRVTPTQGHAALRNVFIAVCVGLALVIVLLTALYRLPGLITAFTTGFFGLLLLFMIATWKGEMMSMASVAGIITATCFLLGLQVLLLERFRKECHDGRSMITAEDAAYKKMIPVIVDSGILLVAAGIILNWLVVGPVKNFALAMAQGAIVALFSVFIVNKYLLKWTLEMFSGKNDKLLVAAQKEKEPKKTGSQKIKWHFIVTAALLVAGLVVGIFVGPNYGMDFAGGTTVVANIGEKYEIADLENALCKAGVKCAPVQHSFDGGHMAIIRVRDDSAVAGIETTLAAEYGKAEIQSVSQTSGLVPRTWATPVIIAISAVCVAAFIYMAFRFGLAAGFVGALSVVFNGAMLLGLLSLLRIQINKPFIAASFAVIMLTLFFTVAVFDRLRENRRVYARQGFNSAQMADAAIANCKPMAIALICMLAVVLPLYFFCVPGDLAPPMILAMVLGLYTPVFLGLPLWAKLMKNRVSDSKKAEIKKAK
ncbi:MAG: hypothetical protein FWD16_01990 [Clostridia bacterium]|nr:hypothetical protein [Clostridia bacterium]